MDRMTVSMKTPGWVTSELSLDTPVNNSGVYEAIRMCVCHVALMTAKQAGIKDPITWFWQSPETANLRAMVDSIKCEGSKIVMVPKPDGSVTMTWERAR